MVVGLKVLEIIQFGGTFRQVSYCYSAAIPIIGPIAIAGLLAEKKFIPEGEGTLKTDTSTFGLMVFAVIAIIAALFLPCVGIGSNCGIFFHVVLKIKEF
jgi:K+-transporting ATPase A subunit